MARTREETLKNVTDTYLNSITPGSKPAPETVQGDILDECNLKIQMYNAACTGKKWREVDSLEPVQAAQCIAKLELVRKIYMTEETEKGKPIIGVYQESGEHEGIYLTDDITLRKCFRKYKYTMTSKDFKEITDALYEFAEPAVINSNRDLVPVNNGIFNYKTKKLTPFSPDYVFMAKSKVNYNPNAQNITIHNSDDGTDWDVESFMKELSDDPEVVELLWQCVGAVIRPNVRWDEAAWFYSETGNNGKGTLCQLMRNLCGEGSCTSIEIADFGKDFMLEPLIGVTAVITDENDVGLYVDKAANLKAIVTGDTVKINRKFKTPVTLQFHGFMVQCFNEMPRVKDNSNSFYRRQKFIAFTKCFTGKERKYIKHDYLYRKEVLEYVMYRVLTKMPDYYTLSNPKSCQQALEEYKTFNDPVRQFVGEILPECKWDLLPFSFLYDLYKEWYRKSMGNQMVMGKPTFIQSLLKNLNVVDGWACPDRTKVYRPGHKMDAAEPLIAEYNLTDWMDMKYTASKDTDKMCHPKLKATYTGIIRE